MKGNLTLVSRSASDFRENFNATEWTAMSVRRFRWFSDCFSVEVKQRAQLYPLLELVFVIEELFSNMRIILETTQCLFDFFLFLLLLLLTSCRFWARWFSALSFYCCLPNFRCDVYFAIFIKPDPCSIPIRHRPLNWISMATPTSVCCLHAHYNAYSPIFRTPNTANPIQLVCITL